MAKLTKKDTLRVAHLAKLDLTQQEIDKFTPQIAAVIELMSELGEVNTKEILPTAQTTNLENILRDDITDMTKVLTQDEALSGTENTKNGFVVVPQILHKDD